jgi:hypothetical protein
MLLCEQPRLGSGEQLGPEAAPERVADLVTDNGCRRASDQRRPRLRWTSPALWVDASSPAVTKRESPGRKNPKNSPDSAKMMAKIPQNP